MNFILLLFRFKNRSQRDLFFEFRITKVDGPKVFPDKMASYA